MGYAARLFVTCGVIEEQIDAGFIASVADIDVAFVAAVAPATTIEP